MLIDSPVSICFPRILRSSSFEKLIFPFFIISPDALATFVISTSFYALCIGHLSSRTTSKSGLSATCSLPSMLVKKQGFIRECNLFRNFKCLFCFRLNIYHLQQLLLLCFHSHSSIKVRFFLYSLRYLILVLILGNRFYRF